MTLNVSMNTSLEGGNFPPVAQHGEGIDARNGSVERASGCEVRIDGGMLGFDHLSLFHLSPLSDEPSEFKLLQSLEDPDVGFVVMSFKDKAFYLQASLDAGKDMDPEDIEILNVVNVDKNSNGIDFFVNLRAPLFVSKKSGIAKQVVLSDSKYPIRLKMVK